MCGPARMCDAHLAVGVIGVDGVLEHLHLADGAQALEMRRAVQHRNAGRVVAAIFQAAEPFHEDGNDVPVSDGSDDTAHVTVPFQIGGASLPEGDAGSKQPTGAESAI